MKRRIRYERVLPLLIVAAGVLSYTNSFRGAFVLDDTKQILSRPGIRGVARFAESGWFRRRFLTDATFAVNYQLGEVNAPDYHAVNLAIHLAAALFLYGLVRRTLLLPRTGASLRAVAAPVAFASAVFWVAHPLTTSSVTYICQRYEAMMGMFYFLSLYSLVRGAGSSRPWRWHLLCVLAVAMGMASKEVMITAPVVILLYDRLFLGRSFREAFGRRRTLYIGLGITWMFVGALLSTGVPQSFVREGAAEVSGQSMAYALTQAEVLVHYLRLSIWPDALCLDYAWPPAAGVIEVLPALVFVAVLGLATAWGLFRGSRTAFLGVWFFAIFAPTSSFLPRPDLAFEHRAYLPLAAVTTGATVGACALLLWLVDRGRVRRGFAIAIAVLGVLGIAGAMGTATHFRNRVFYSQERVWRDAAAKRPANLRARTAVVASLLRQGRFTEAERDAREILRHATDMLDSGTPRRHVTASNPQFHYSIAHNQIGLALLAKGRTEESLPHFTRAIETALGHKSLYLFNRALANRALDRGGEALGDLRASLDLKPEDEETHAMMGKVLAETGEHAEARMHYEKALALDPGFDWARLELAWLMATSPETNVRDGREALRLVLSVGRELRENSFRAMEVAAAAYAEIGEFTNAVRAAETAMRFARRERQIAIGPEDTARRVASYSGAVEIAAERMAAIESAADRYRLGIPLRIPAGEKPAASRKHP